MSEALRVHHRNALVGKLERWRFEYDRDWLDQGWALSASLPRRPEPYERAAQWWFENLLPEGRVREHIVRRFRIDPNDDFALLEKLGGECAGALTLDAAALTSGDIDPPGPDHRRYRVLTPSELAQLGELGVTAVFGDETRLSLAGAQHKLAVRRCGDRLLLPEGNAASTHILKLPSTDDAAIVENELLTLRLASAVGLEVVRAEPIALGDRLGLLIERYDRKSTRPTARPDEPEQLALSPVERIHQEDLVQATGRPRQRKYEQGGGIRFFDCIDLVRRSAPQPALEIDRLLRWFAFCFVVGNRDNHGKNLSRLYDPTIDRWSLAPFYDLVCTCAYRRLDRRLAMHIAGEAEPNQISRATWAAFAQDLRVSPRLVVRIVSELRDAVLDTLPATRDTVAGELDTHPGTGAGAGAGEARLVQFVQAITKSARLATQSLQ